MRTRCVVRYGSLGHTKGRCSGRDLMPNTRRSSTDLKGKSPLFIVLKRPPVAFIKGRIKKPNGFATKVVHDLFARPLLRRVVAWEGLLHGVVA